MAQHPCQCQHPSTPQSPSWQQLRLQHHPLHQSLISYPSGCSGSCCAVEKSSGAACCRMLLGTCPAWICRLCAGSIMWLLAGGMTTPR